LFLFARSADARKRCLGFRPSCWCC
jgi:hypothetical protein